ncbi:MAG: LysR family transcriptional regulator [Pseudonocardiaceae bacterium]
MPAEVMIRQLEYLVALARERHFARAAAACHVSQPALSAGVRKLETELGVMIVLRGQRFAGFTAEGEHVVGWAHRILAERDALLDDLNRMRQGLSATLRVGAIPTAVPASSLLTAPFCARNPLARVRIEVLPSREILRRLAEFDLDVGLTYIDAEALHGVRATALYRESYLLLTPSDGELAGRACVGWAEAAATPLCMLSPVMQNRRILDGIIAAAGATLNPVVETDTVAALYAHVATRKWSSIIAHAWLHAFGVPDGMQIIPLHPPARSPQIGLVRADRDPEPMVAGALLEAVRDVDLPTILDALLARYVQSAQS